jgi:hypothetical protein
LRERRQRPRWYDWALVATTSPAHQLLIRRSITKPDELAFYLCHATGPVALPQLIRVAGTCWTIEECFQIAKNETALDHYQVRLYPAWYRYITLAMLAMAFLAVMRADLAGTEPGNSPISDQPVPISANEIRCLFAQLCRPPTDPQHTQHTMAESGHRRSASPYHVHGPRRTASRRPGRDQLSKFGPEFSRHDPHSMTIRLNRRGGLQRRARLRPPASQAFQPDVSTGPAPRNDTINRHRKDR